MKNEINNIFEEIRDIPYSIPESFTLQNTWCSWKAILLKQKLENLWITCHYRVCDFYWDTLNIPDNILKIPHDNYSTHVYIEMNFDGKEIILDPTWDMWLKDIFQINIWDKQNSTDIAVSYNEIFSIEKSTLIMENINECDFQVYMNRNKDFCSALNNYFDQVRKKS